MINNSQVQLQKDKEAIKTSIRLLLASEKLSFFGDPNYGCNLLKLLFEQANVIVSDIIIDEIYTALSIYIPQVKIERKNVEIYNDKFNLYTNIKYVYRIDNTSDMLTIKLTNYE